MKILITTLFIIICLIDLITGQSCSLYGDGQSVACNAASACKWVGTVAVGQCNCASEVKLDILFGIDTSGSIGYDGFQIQKEFVTGLIDNGVANGSRIGFYMFNTNVNQTENIDFWDKADLLRFAAGMYWTGGWTNTPQLVSDALVHFAATFDPTRQQVFIIITDGNPCLPDAQGGCPQTACQYKTQVFQAGIRVVVIGVGDGLNSKYVKCLTQTDDDWIPVSGYTQAAFDTILGSLSDVLCPISKEFKVTEVKATKKTGNSLKARLTRFVEVYNSGIDFNVNDIAISGLITMTQASGPDVMVAQSQYLVFYDASEAPTTESTVTTGSTPTCHLCEWDASNGNLPCDLSSCSTWAGIKAYTGTCFCANSIYIACANDAAGTSACNSNVAISANANTYNGCGACSFSSTMSKDSWTVTFSDGTGGQNEIDTVEYGKTGTGSWISVLSGYSLELAWKGFDNDYGTSWIQSCSEYGTPGSDPFAQCDETCVTLSADCGAGTCDPDSGNCVCDLVTGYYPSCTQNGACFQCAEIPEVSECVVVWRKNGTDKYAYYNWTTSAPAVNGGFFLQYFAGANGGNCPIGSGGFDSPCDTSIKQVGEFAKSDAIYSPFKHIDGYYAGNDTIGGFVYAFEAVCDTSSINTASTCEYYVSDAIPCTVITGAPTASPTNSPTQPPTPEPTNDPTMSPTYACPRYWIQNDDICNSDTDDGYAGDRCTCTGKSVQGSTQACCLLDPDFTVTYDQNRQHKTTDECKMDTQLNAGQCRYDDDCEVGSSEGYLLSNGKHSFDVVISDDAQPCTFDICWKLQFTETDCNYETRRRLADSTISDGEITCDPDSTSLAAAGLSIDVTSGCLKVWTQNDEKNATIDFQVKRLNCNQAETALAEEQGTAATPTSSPTATVRRRRLAQDCFTNIAIKGELVLVNATSQCQPDCDDGRIYPMRFPIWYNYAAAFVAPPAGEKELPAWLWWLIAALVVFLALLALLVYKYWWKNKATGAALGATQADLDAAVMENEQGFGGDLGNGAVGFNPLATGFNPNQAAGPMNPNAPPNAQPNGQDFIRPAVEPIKFRQAYGQNVGGQMR